MKNNTMKKYAGKALSSILATVLVLSIAGCSKKTDENEASNESTNSQTEISGGPTHIVDEVIIDAEGNETIVDSSSESSAGDNKEENNDAGNGSSNNSGTSSEVGNSSSGNGNSASGSSETGSTEIAQPGDSGSSELPEMPIDDDSD